MKIKVLKYDFSICKTSDFSLINRNSAFCFTATTDEEYSLVCISEDVPKNTLARTDGWKALKIDGILDFSLVGIIAKISTLLANKNISIFTVSTYNTDYLFIKSENLDKAITILQDNLYEIEM